MHSRLARFAAEAGGIGSAAAWPIASRSISLSCWPVTPAVRADNNVAEPALRPAVVTRKTSLAAAPKLARRRLLGCCRSFRRGTAGIWISSPAHTPLAQGCSQSYRVTPSFRYRAGGTPISRLKALRKAASDS